MDGGMGGMKISVLSLLPMFLYITDRQVAYVPVITRVPVITLSSLGLLTIVAWGYYQGGSGKAMSMAGAAVAVLAVPVALGVLIQGGGPVEVATSLVDALIDLNDITRLL